MSKSRFNRQVGQWHQGNIVRRSKRREDSVATTRQFERAHARRVALVELNAKYGGGESRRVIRDMARELGNRRASVARALSSTGVRS